jgi:hypothetical protein
MVVTQRPVLERPQFGATGYPARTPRKSKATPWVVAAAIVIILGGVGMAGWMMFAAVGDANFQLPTAQSMIGRFPEIAYDEGEFKGSQQSVWAMPPGSQMKISESALAVIGFSGSAESARWGSDIAPAAVAREDLRNWRRFICERSIDCKLNCGQTAGKVLRDEAVGLFCQVFRAGFGEGRRIAARGGGFGSAGLGLNWVCLGMWAKVDESGHFRTS